MNPVLTGFILRAEQGPASILANDRIETSADTWACSAPRKTAA